MSDFDPADYWEGRLRSDYSLGGVGYRRLGRGYNRWAYRVRKHTILRALRELQLPSEAHVLDVGSGTGFMIDIWRQAGISRIDGCDITDVAVERLAARFPSSTFSKVDVGSESFPYGSQFDAISANDVMFHIVEDLSYQKAIENVARALKPGGVFVFTDFFRHGGTVRGQHWVWRRMTDITAGLEGAGLEVVNRRPLFVLMNAPADSGKVLRGWWWSLSALLSVAPWTGRFVGAVLYGPELLLCRSVKDGPSTELMISRRPVGR